MNTKLDLDAIEKACREATPGPWLTVEFDGCTPDEIFIANAREWVPALLRRARELESALRNLDEDLT